VVRETGDFLAHESVRKTFAADFSRMPENCQDVSHEETVAAFQDNEICDGMWRDAQCPVHLISSAIPLGGEM
jgi:hypothetical protein